MRTTRRIAHICCCGESQGSMMRQGVLPPLLPVGVLVPQVDRN